MSKEIAHKLDDETIVRTSDVLICENVSFSKMMLSELVLNGLTKAGFKKPSPIQLRAIPLGRSGLDLLIRAKSGTGKTLVFATIILEAYRNDITAPQSLILVPTREIAVQIENVLKLIGYAVQGFRVSSFIGGLDIVDDRKKIANCSAIVGTPGRIRHLITNGILNTEKIKLLVLDEADKLMSDTFCKDIEVICTHLPVKRQVLAVSATFDNGLDELLRKFMKSPIGVTPQKDAPPVLLGVKQFAYEMEIKNDQNAINGGVPQTVNFITQMNAKISVLQTIFGSIPFKQCLVFSNSQSRAESYCNYLTRNGWPADVIMGNQKQTIRLDVFRKFRKFQCRILVATDLMARGIDSENVNLVVNLDVPDDSSVYLHRIGRCGRFGSQGIAITLLESTEALHKFRKLLGGIGGKEMRVLKYDPKLVTDIWTKLTTPNEEAELFGEICGIDENRLELDQAKLSAHGTVMKGDNTTASSKDNDTEIIEKNMLLLNISRLLVDPPKNKEKPETDTQQTDDLFDSYSMAVNCSTKSKNSMAKKNNNHNEQEIPNNEDLFESYTRALNLSTTLTNEHQSKKTKHISSDDDSSSIVVNCSTKSNAPAIIENSFDDLFDSYHRAINCQTPNLEPNTEKIPSNEDLFDNYSMAVNCSTKSTNTQTNRNREPVLTDDDTATNAIFLDAIARLNLYPDDAKAALIEKSDNLSTSVKETIGSSTTTSRKSASTDRNKIFDKNENNLSGTEDEEDNDDDEEGAFDNHSVNNEVDNDDEVVDDESSDESSVFVDCETSDNDEEAEEYEKCQQQQMADSIKSPYKQNLNLWQEIYNRQVQQITNYVYYSKGAAHWYEY